MKTLYKWLSILVVGVLLATALIVVSSRAEAVDEITVEPENQAVSISKPEIVPISQESARNSKLIGTPYNCVLIGGFDYEYLVCQTDEPEVEEAVKKDKPPTNKPPVEEPEEPEPPVDEPEEPACKNKNSGKDGTPGECNAGGGQEKNKDKGKKNK